MIICANKFNEEKHLNKLIEYVNDGKIKIKFNLYWSGKEYIMAMLFYNDNSNYEYQTTDEYLVKRVKAACLNAL